MSGNLRRSSKPLFGALVTRPSPSGCRATGDRLGDIVGFIGTWWLTLDQVRFVADLLEPVRVAMSAGAAAERTCEKLSRFPGLECERDSMDYPSDPVLPGTAIREAQLIPTKECQRNHAHVEQGDRHDCSFEKYGKASEVVTDRKIKIGQPRHGNR